jgi:WD40 repeat protein
VTALAWCPDGQRLAGASEDCSRVVVWDAALGTGALVRLGLDPVALLRWSPCGAYLFAGARGPQATVG